MVNFDCHCHAVSLLESAGITSELLGGCGGDDGGARHHVCALAVAKTSDGAKIDSLYGHILGNGSIVLLLGSFAIGAITGQEA